MVKYIIYLYLLLLPICSFPQEIETEADVDTTDYLIGDFINYRVKVNHQKNIEVFFPSVKDSLEKLELISSLPVERNEDEKFISLTYKYILAGYDSGSFVIPSLLIPYKSKNDTVLYFVTTDSLVISIHTIAVDTTAEIKDIKEPLTIPLDWLQIAIVILAVLILVMIIYYFVKKYLRKNKGIIEGKIVKKLPHEEALESLTVLKEKKLWQNGFIKEYHTDITGIIRKYYEERFSLPALELTTSEVIEYLKKNAETSEIVDLTDDFLNNADMVKFAKFIPMDSINEEMMNQATKIIEITIPIKENKEETNV